MQNIFRGLFSGLHMDISFKSFSEGHFLVHLNLCCLTLLLCLELLGEEKWLFTLNLFFMCFSLSYLFWLFFFASLQSSGNEWMMHIFFCVSHAIVVHSKLLLGSQLHLSTVNFWRHLETFMCICWTFNFDTWLNLEVLSVSGGVGWGGVGWLSE